MAHGRNYPWHPTAKITDLRDLLLQSASRYSDKNAFLPAQAGAAVTYRQLQESVFALGAGLFELGFGPGRKAALLSENRWEWGLSYLSAACGGGVNVPIDKELRPQDIRHILDQTGAEFLLTSGRNLEVVLELRAKLPSLRHVICFDRTQPEAGVLALSEVLERGQSLLQRSRTTYPRIEIEPRQPVSLVYTSGTMGSSKGVILTHENLVSNVMDMCKAVYIDENDRLLSVLPLNHTYECTCGLLAPLSRGCAISYCDNFRRIADQMRAVQATAMLGVPLLFGTMCRKILDGIREKGMRKFQVGKVVASVAETLLGGRIRRTVFSTLHQKFGGRLRLLISGGAASDPEVARFFRSLGITFIQGYGLTESSPILTVNRPRFFEDSSAGLPLPSVELRIAEDGEVCARGPNIMTGYFNNPEATAEVLQDGWFHTGDLGYLDSQGFLYLHGRKKAVIVLINGKNVYPEEIEQTLNHSPFILESLVWEGADVPHDKIREIQAIAVPNRETFDGYCRDNGLALSEELVEEVLRKEIRRQCAGLPSYKRVRKFTIRWEEFDKTTTRKIKRYLYTEKAKKVAR
jgi:long-chain acyl-CoA synthetase